MAQRITASLSPWHVAASAEVTITNEIAKLHNRGLAKSVMIPS